jgi:hypothetical protein
MIVSLLLIMGTFSKSVLAVIKRAEAQESMLERVITLFVPLVMPDHLLFLDEDLKATVHAVVVFAIHHVLAMGALTVLKTTKPIIQRSCVMRCVYSKHLMTLAYSTLHTEVCS